MSIYKSGAIPSPPDDRDWRITHCMDMPAGNVCDTLPRVFEVSYLPPIKEQVANSCTAHAITTILSCIWYKLTGEKRDFSIGYSYGNRRETHHKGEGQIMRHVTKSTQKYGDVFNNIYEDLSEVPDVINNFEATYDTIKDHAKKIVAGYVRIRSEAEAKAFLVKYDVPLFVGTAVNRFVPGGPPNAYHAMACTGYGERGVFYNQNSWGTENFPCPELVYEAYEEIWGIIPMEKMKFTDVDSDRWSAEAIEEAAQDGIIQGFPDGTFAPEQPLTREQIAVMWERMKRYNEEHFEKNL